MTAGRLAREFKFGLCSGFPLMNDPPTEEQTERTKAALAAGNVDNLLSRVGAIAESKHALQVLLSTA